MSTDPFSARLTHLRQALSPHQAFFLTNPTDIWYYAGFQSLVPEEREGFLLVTPQKTYLFHASFSPVPQTPELLLLPGTSAPALVKHLTDIQSSTAVTELLIDKTKLFADEFEALQSLPSITLTSLDHQLVWSHRMSKDATEIAAIRQASSIARDALKQIQPLIKEGMTELVVQRLLEIEMIKLGSEKVAFPTIVCFGEHAALPHHQPTNTKLANNTAILIDFGATVKGYRSDMTRTFWYGETPSATFTKVETIIMQAYQAVIALLKHPSSSLTAADTDKAARQLINDAGYGKNFIHTTGHGVGLDIHENPSLNWTNPTPLKPGMVITVEPGIYLEGELGFRYENTILLTDSGVDELTL